MQAATGLPRRATGIAVEIASGFRSLLIGFGFWKHRTGLMFLGLVPAAIAAVILYGGLAVLLVFIDPIVTAITPFATEWDPFWQGATRITIGVAIVVTAGILSARVFTALALTLGGPLYERIGRQVDDAYGAPERPGTPGFWRSIGDMGRIVLRSIIGAIGIGLIALIPVVGGAVSAVLGVLFTADVISREFTLQAMQERGLDSAARRAMLKPHRWARLGFGLGVQLCYLVPLGAVFGTPGAVAGGTHLARRMLGETVVLPMPSAAARPTG